MKESIQHLGPKPPKRLSFRTLRGWYKYERLPYKVHYNLKSSTDDDLNEKNPGQFILTQDSGPGASGEKSLSIFIHESVPKEYRDIVFFHELVEAEFSLVDGLDKPMAHQKAVQQTEEYAKSHLSEEDFQKFREWQERLDQY